MQRYFEDKHAIITSFAAQFARGNKIKRRFLPHIGRLVNPARMVIITQRPGFYPSSTFFNYFPRVATPYIKLQRMSVFDPSRNATGSGWRARRALRSS